MEVFKKRYDYLQDYKKELSKNIKNKGEHFELYQYINNLSYPNITNNEIQLLIDKCVEKNSNAIKQLFEISQVYIATSIIRNHANKQISILDLIQEINIKFYNYLCGMKKTITVSKFYNILSMKVSLYCKRLLQNKSSIDYSYYNNNISYKMDDEIIDRLDLKEIIDKLSPNRKKLIYLYFYFGYTESEIAKLKKCSQSNIYQHLKSTYKIIKNISLNSKVYKQHEFIDDNTQRETNIEIKLDNNINDLDDKVDEDNLLPIVDESENSISAEFNIMQLLNIRSLKMLLKDRFSKDECDIIIDKIRYNNGIMYTNQYIANKYKIPCDKVDDIVTEGIIYIKNKFDEEFNKLINETDEYLEKQPKTLTK